MSEEFKAFCFALEQSAGLKGMVWHGGVPKAEIKEAFGVNVNGVNFNVMGIYVEVKPRYEAQTPDWLRSENG
jgi:hypothetical protein